MSTVLGLNNECALQTLCKTLVLKDALYKRVKDDFYEFFSYRNEIIDQGSTMKFLKTQLFLYKRLLCTCADRTASHLKVCSVP